MQKRLFSILAFAFFTSAFLTQASAADAKPAASGCEEKAVSKSGKPLAGAAKATFMKKCEAEGKSGATTAAEAPKSSQQQKMKDCNAEAKTKALKGDERKTFMKGCLSGGKK